MATNIKNRVPAYPGRVKLLPVAGQADTYTMTRADAPTEPGTAVNKALLDAIGVHTLDYAKSGTVHGLTGLNGASGVLSCQFKATAGFAAGDSVTVDGTAYTIKLSNGKAAKKDLFVSGSIVSCILDTVGKTVNFKAGGGYVQGDLIPKYDLQPQLSASYTGSLTPSYVNANITSNISVNQNGTVYGLYADSTAYDLVRIRPGRDPEVKSLGVGNKPSVYGNYVCADETDDDIVYLNYGSTIAKVKFSTLEVVWSVSGSFKSIPYNNGSVICCGSGGNGTKAEFLTLSTHTIATYTWSAYTDLTGWGMNTSCCMDKEGDFYIWTGDTSESDYGKYLMKIDPATAALIWKKKVAVAAGSCSTASAWDEVLLSQNGLEDANNSEVARYSLDGTLIAKQTVGQGIWFKLPTTLTSCGYIRYSHLSNGWIYSTGWSSDTPHVQCTINGDPDGVYNYAVSYNSTNPFSTYLFCISVSTTSITRWDLPFDSYKILEEE